MSDIPFPPKETDDLRFPSLDALRTLDLVEAIDRQFVLAMLRMVGESSPEVSLALAWLSRGLREGHVCLDLAALAGRPFELEEDSLTAGFDEASASLDTTREILQAQEWLFPELEDWLLALRASALVMEPADAVSTSILERATMSDVPESNALILNTPIPNALRPETPIERRPLVLDGRDRLYLWRYWDHEQTLADAIRARLGPPPVPPEHPAHPAHSNPDKPNPDKPNPDNPNLERPDPGYHDANHPHSDFGEDSLDKGRLSEAIAVLDAESAQAPQDRVDWQFLAMVTSQLGRFTAVTGGPGTGKTTTVLGILRLALMRARLEGRAYPTIALLAPTGKAAGRMAEALEEAIGRLEGGHGDDPSDSPSSRRSERSSDRSIDQSPYRSPYRSPAKPSSLSQDLQAIPREASTIHRSLGMGWDGPTRPLRNAEYPLDAEIIIVDEASMIDLALFRRLMDAIKPDAQLILLGDADQLSSVEAGAAFSDICNAGRPINPSARFWAQMEALAGRPLSPAGEERARVHSPNQGREKGVRPAMGDRVIRLEHSYRFDSQSGIGRLSSAIQAGDVKAALRHLEDPNMPDTTWLDPEWAPSGLSDPEHARGKQAHDLEKRFEKIVQESYKAFRDALERGDMEASLAGLDEFRVLCAHRKGPEGVEAMNSKIQALLGLENAWPIIVGRNDAETGLFNGDIGIWSEAEGGLPMAYFRDTAGGLRKFRAAEIPDCEPAFALTIHKSQGSEFERVLVVLPRLTSPLLSRELLYTAITRAKAKVDLIAGREVLIHALQSRVQRWSGLREILWETGPLDSNP